MHFQQHSPQFYRQTSDESIKSESPSRKRRRLSRSGHHIELNTQPPSPPRRSPRQHPPSTPHHPMQVGIFSVALRTILASVNYYICSKYFCGIIMLVIIAMDYSMLMRLSPIDAYIYCIILWIYQKYLKNHSICIIMWLYL